MWKTLLIYALPAVAGAGVIDVLFDGLGDSPVDEIAGTLAVIGATAGAAARAGKLAGDASAPATPQAGAVTEQKSEPVPPPPPKRPEGEDALVLLQTLQREARLVDFLKEDLAGYDDAQVGAAVRDVHRDAAAVLDRLFAPAPAVSVEEGSELDPATQPPGRVRTVGGAGGGTGTVVHAGWAATKVNLPARTGPADDASARVIAPAEVEVN